MSEPLLRVEHLCQYFGENKAVDDVSFELQKGEVFGLVGESGCGKTTTGRAIIRLYDITSGNIYFKGQRIGAGTGAYKDEIAKARQRMKTAPAEERKKLQARIDALRGEIRSAKEDMRRIDARGRHMMAEDVEKMYADQLEGATGEARAALLRQKEYDLKVARRQHFITKIQMIFQDPIASLDPRMTVYDTIAEGLRIRGERDRAVVDEKVYRILERVGLVREHAGRYPHEFSGGQRQRIGVARAIVMQPELIIADEPVSALDVSIQAQVINLLSDLRRELGLTILFIAHDLSVVKYFSDRIGVMYYGHMVEMADSDELFRHPLHPYTRSLLSAIPLPDPVFEQHRVRVVYNPLTAHDYGDEVPELREAAPGHWVRASENELLRYRQDLAGQKA